VDGQTLQKLFVLANEFKEGDLPLGGTRDDAVRSEARRVLGAVKLRTLAATVLVEDSVSESLLRTLKPVPTDIAHLTLNQVKDSLIGARGAALGPGVRRVLEQRDDRGGRQADGQCRAFSGRQALV